MPREHIRPQQWFTVGEYLVVVHSAHEEQLPGGLGGPSTPAPALPLSSAGPDPAQQQRVVYLEVEYQNRTANKTLSCRRNQWLLYDTVGYSYEAEPNNDQLYRNRGRQFLGGDRPLNPGGRLRGWVAYKVPASAIIERVQFIDGFLSGNTDDVVLRAAEPGQTVPLRLEAVPRIAVASQRETTLPAEALEQELIRLTHERAAALIGRDLEYLERLLAPEFRYVNAHGQLLDRDAYLQQIASGRLQLSAQAVDELDVQLHGDVALVTCLLSDQGLFDGTPFGAHFRAVHIYRRGDAGWRMMFGQSTQADRLGRPMSAGKAPMG